MLPSQNQWKKALRLTWTVTVSVALAACSSSNKSTSENEEGLEDAPVADAGTDAVPVTGAEDPSATPPADAGADPTMAGTDNGAGQPAAEPQGAEDPNATAAADPMPTTDPAADPSATPTPAEPMEGSGAYESYSFKSGDTLMQVAFETYGDLYQWRRILEANRDVISDPNHIPVGTQLKIERPASPVSVSRNGEAYRIRSGDTLGTISNQVYGTTSKWREIWDNNRELIKDPNKIYAGFTLYYLPMGEANPLAKGTSSPAEPASDSANSDATRQPASADPQPTTTEAAPAGAGTTQ